MSFLSSPLYAGHTALDFLIVAIVVILFPVMSVLTGREGFSAAIC